MQGYAKETGTWTHDWITVNSARAKATGVLRCLCMLEVSPVWQLLHNGSSSVAARLLLLVFLSALFLRHSHIYCYYNALDIPPRKKNGNDSNKDAKPMCCGRHTGNNWNKQFLTNCCQNYCVYRWDARRWGKCVALMISCSISPAATMDVPTQLHLFLSEQIYYIITLVLFGSVYFSST